MMYNLLVGGREAPSEMLNILTEVFAVPPESVDVSDAAEFDSRNWDAVVTCDYEALSGDVQWSLEIYASDDDVQEQPDEGALAVEVARALGAPVLFPGDQQRPDVWRLATPEGTTMYARVSEPDGDDEVFRVTQVEKPVPEFPQAEAGPFADLVKVVQLPTPLTDAAATAHYSEAVRRVLDLLVNWERLTVRMTTGWPPFAWYPARMYEDDLQLRDQVDALAGELPEADRERILRQLSLIDARYAESTVEDGGAALADQVQAETGRAPQDLAERPWYWHRRPEPPPWRA